MSHLLEPCSHRENKIKIELDLCNYATKSNLKSATCIDKSKFNKKADLPSIK